MDIGDIICIETATGNLTVIEIDDITEKGIEYRMSAKVASEESPLKYIDFKVETTHISQFTWGYIRNITARNDVKKGVPFKYAFVCVADTNHLVLHDGVKYEDSVECEGWFDLDKQEMSSPKTGSPWKFCAEKTMDSFKVLA